MAEFKAPPVEPDLPGTALTFETLTRQVDLIAEGKTTSLALTTAALDRARALQPKLGCFRVLVEEQALAAAKQADRLWEEGERRALLGIPVAIKDDVDLAGSTTQYGSGGDHPPAERDSEVVRRLKDAGAVIIGKTMTSEIGQWPFSESEGLGEARNPWNPDYTPGGSSGGAAAAVAAGIVAAAIGSDGAGSVRIPASWCGLVGLKPQRGRISTWPEVDAFQGLACYGPITRTAADAALLLDAISGSHPDDAHKPAPPDVPFEAAALREPGRLRIAVSFSVPFGIRSNLDGEVREAVMDLAERLSGLGHSVVEIDPDYGLVGPAFVPRGLAGVSDWCRRRVGPNATLEQRTETALRIGRVLGWGPALRSARALEGRAARRIGGIFRVADMILTPTTASPPQPVGAQRGRGWLATSTAAASCCPYTFAWNVTGWPALSIPAGRTASGLPVGAQLLGAEGDEAGLLSLGRQLEGVVQPLERSADPRS